MRVLGAAVFSPCETWRYVLTRRWEPPGPSIHVLWVLLNPSTATATEDDPTIRRTIGFSKAWGCGSLTVANAFALRSTDPKALREAEDPVGPENDAHIAAWARAAHFIVAAWGRTGRSSTGERWSCGCCGPPARWSTTWG